MAEDGRARAPRSNQIALGWLQAPLKRAGDSAAFPKGTGNGHHLINKSTKTAVYLEVGSRAPADVTTCSDIDMMSTNTDGRFTHKDGRPY